METKEMIRRIVRLEMDIAAFYAQLGTVKRFDCLVPVFAFLERHSRAHAGQIEKLIDQFHMAPLDTAPLFDIQQRIKRNLAQELAAHPDNRQVLKSLARAEEVVGQIYERLARHYAGVADDYRRFSEALAALSREEFEHRDHVSTEGERCLAASEAAGTTPS